MPDPTRLTAAAAIAAIKQGDVDAGELFESYRKRSAANRFNANCWVAAETPELDTGSRLAGLPLAVKDLFCTEGVVSQAGSELLRGYKPPYTATAVSKLLDAGAALLSKTNQDEFAMGSSNEHCAFGDVVNPWAAGRVPGGSSGGSAAAVASGEAPWALGTDTGGSIRQPAAFCGIVGLKPTYGTVSRYGMIAFASSLDQAGVFTRDVTDAALLYGHMTGKDPMDATSVAHPEAIKPPTRTSLDGITIGTMQMLEDAELKADMDVALQFSNALDAATRLGATTTKTRLEHAEYALAAYYVLAPAEASSNLSRFDGVRYGNRVEAGDLVSMYTKTRHDGFGAEVKRRILIGTYALSSGYYDAYYGRAQRVRTKISEDFSKAFESVDVIASLTAPTTAFELGAKVDNPLAMYLNDLYTIPASLAGLPGISIPIGTVDGLPVGLQLVGPAFSENKLLDIAYAIEQEIGFRGAPWETV